jgi:hypothetical protein
VGFLLSELGEQICWLPFLPTLYLCESPAWHNHEALCGETLFFVFPTIVGEQKKPALLCIYIALFCPSTFSMQIYHTVTMKAFLHMDVSVFLQQFLPQQMLQRE